MVLRGEYVSLHMCYVGCKVCASCVVPFGMCLTLGFLTLLFVVASILQRFYGLSFVCWGLFGMFYKCVA